MRILMLATAFNSLTQRIWIELSRRGHDVSLELDVNDAVTTEAVRLFKPDVIVAPYLRRAIPEAVWRAVPCLIVHPGPAGDRGPSALDWAILSGAGTWGVTVLQATAELDAGDVWSTINFPLRAASKSSLYRTEVTEAAVLAVLEALDRFARGDRPTPLSDFAPMGGTWRPLMTDADRMIAWASDDTARVLAKVRASDGQPGAPAVLFGQPCRLYDAHSEPFSHGGEPGDVVGRRDGALLVKTRDGAVWIGTVKRAPLTGERAFKVAATTGFRADSEQVPARPLSLAWADGRLGFQEIAYREVGKVGYLAFDFYNGAMSTDDCQRLLAAYRDARARPTKVLVLLGGREFWSNGMDLSAIEAADSPPEESFANINAIDDVAREIILTDDKLTISAIRGNAGAGGVFLALAADIVVARHGAVFNPHYKNMGNLFGSEYWTYLLPKKLGPDKARAVMDSRLPICAIEAQALGLIDEVFSIDRDDFLRDVHAFADSLAHEATYGSRLAEKRWQRQRDEGEKPLHRYRQDELERMKLNFFGFDPSYHVARYNFVTKVPHSRTPFHLARHRAQTIAAAE
jgi:putative two-component system protein, hydrogenase maturation factor HypX/HoxX